MNKQFTIRSINGVAYNQTVDGSIIAHVSTSNAEALKAELVRLVESINEWQIACIERQKQAVQLQQLLPPSPQQKLEAQLTQLRADAEIAQRLRGMIVDDPEARAKTIVGEGVDMSSDDLGPPPESL